MPTSCLEKTFVVRGLWGGDRGLAKTISGGGDLDPSKSKRGFGGTNCS